MLEDDYLDDLKISDILFKMYYMVRPKEGHWFLDYEFYNLAEKVAKQLNVSIGSTIEELNCPYYIPDIEEYAKISHSDIFGTTLPNDAESILQEIYDHTAYLTLHQTAPEYSWIPLHGESRMEVNRLMFMMIMIYIWKRKLVWTFN